MAALMGKITKIVLAELASNTTKNSPASNRAKFLSMKDDIKALITTEGIPVISVWRVLTAKKYVSYSYETFNRYCKIYISNHAANQPPKAKPIPPPKPKKVLAAKISEPNDGEPIVTGSSTTPRFTFDSNPDKEDLF